MPKTPERPAFWEKPISRRAFIKYAPVAIAVTPEVATQAAIATVSSSRPLLEGIFSFFIRQTHSQPQPINLEAAFTSPKVLRENLDFLNNQILKQPENSRFYLNQVLRLAVTYFGRELDIDPSPLFNSFSLEEEQLFFQRMVEIRGCKNSDVPLDNRGYVHPLENIAHIDLDFILYRDVKRKAPRPDAGTFLLAEALHELHHLNSPLKPLDPPELIPDSARGQIAMAIWQKGLISLAANKDKSLPQKTCWTSYRYQLEEAVTQDSTDRMLDKIGLTMTELGQYETYVRIYRRQVLERLYKGNNRSLLLLQQATQKDQFFASIGQKLNAPQGKEALAGESYVANLLANQ